MHVAYVAVAAVNVHSHLYHIGDSYDLIPHLRLPASKPLSLSSCLLDIQ